VRPGALTSPPPSLLFLVAARRWLDVVEVRGRSMAPTLLPGDRLLVVRVRPRLGDVVLAPDPRMPSRELIKRVTAADARGIQLRGDNPDASTDARSFGAVSPDAVHWRALVRYWPMERIGRVPHPGSSPGGESACAFPEVLVVG
jgi:nickel-type superoxide dismutase maturation protease